MEMVLDGKVLKSVLKGLSVLVVEARWKINENGIQSRAVDPSNVAMVFADIYRDGMESMDVDEETVIGVDVNRLLDIVGNVKKDTLVELKVSDSSLNVKIGSLRYNVSLIDPSAIRKEPKMPNLDDLPAKIVMDAKQFKEAINFAGKISDEVALVADDKEFWIEAEGDVDRIVCRYNKSQLIEFKGAEAKSKFSIEYLKQFCKVATNSTLTIRLGSDYPIKMVFDIDGKAAVGFILAPRIDVE